MYPMDVETSRLLAGDRAGSLARAMYHAARAAPMKRRQRLGLWLVGVGLRLACERPLLSRA